MNVVLDSGGGNNDDGDENYDDVDDGGTFFHRLPRSNNGSLGSFLPFPGPGEWRR